MTNKILRSHNFVCRNMIIYNIYSSWKLLIKVNRKNGNAYFPVINAGVSGGGAKVGPVP